MTDEAFGWLILVVGFIAAIGALAAVAAIFESQWQRRRDREQRLPPPAWRARVVRRWRVPE